MKALLCISAGFNLIYQYPLRRSKDENTLAEASLSISSYVRGIGYLSRFVKALSPRKSVQKRRLPSGFLTNSTGEAHGLLECCMMPARRRSSISC